MPDGFFHSSTLLPPKNTLSIIPECSKCTLYKHCKSPKMEIYGQGKKKILIHGEAPGQSEDDQGIPFRGKAGSYLKSCLDAIGIDMDRDCWLSNSLRCFISPKVLVYTSEGYKQIRNVQVGDLVLTHKGRFRKVLSRSQDLPLSERMNKGKLVDIKVGTVKLTVTADHPFLNDGEWIRADEIEQGQQIQVMGEKCSECGTPYFKNPTIFDVAGSFCSRNCLNQMVGRKNGKALSTYMKSQYAEGKRDGMKMTEAAHKAIAKRVEEGTWNPMDFISMESRESAWTKAALWRQGHNCLKEGKWIGHGEREIAAYLIRKKIEFYSQYAVGRKNFDFFLPDYGILFEVENPETIRCNKNVKKVRYPRRQKLADELGHKLIFLKSVDPLYELKRILKNDDHEYVFLSQKVKSVTVRLPTRQEYLYCLEIEEDHSYISKGLVSHNCRPENNRTPTNQEISFCRPNLTKAIQDLEPDIIIPLGGPAVQSLIGGIWKEDVGNISRWVGWEIPCQKPNAWIFPNFHPSYVIRSEGKPDEKVIKLWFNRWLKTAVEREGKPWPNGPPDYQKQCRIILSPDEASRKIRKLVSWALENNKPLAFDYECDRLKPQRNESLLYSCSISNGKVSISYPMIGEAREATKEFLVSKVKKISANCKYEILWSYFSLGVKVSSIVFDTMISAHILDNRQKTKSLKFQAFVLLGQTSYDDHIKMFFKSNGTNEPNRIKEIELNQLLLYGAMDSLLEFKIAQIQAKQLGIEL